ncbi:MAG: hypothetical protein WCS94_14380, partial [Verrucomicrobiota bacterium]
QHDLNLGIFHKNLQRTKQVTLRPRLGQLFLTALLMLMSFSCFVTLGAGIAPVALWTPSALQRIDFRL